MRQSKVRLNTQTKYALAGIAFGFAFPLAGWIVDILRSDLTFSLAALVQIHHENPVHYITDLAPFVLGTIFYFFGKTYQTAISRNYFAALLATDRVTGSSLRTKILLAIVVVGSLVVLGLSSAFMQKTMRLKSQEQIGKSLDAVLATIEQATFSRSKEDRAHVSILAATEHIVHSAQDLMALRDRRQNLTTSSAHTELRTWLQPIVRTLGYQGYFLISPQGINLASDVDGNTGKKNMSSHHRDFLEKIWQGDTALSAPHHAETPLANHAGELQKGLITMFAGAPIKDAAGEIIAALVLRIDPYIALSPTLEQGRIGDSGETYAFIKEGEIISASRFIQQIDEFGIRVVDANGVAHLEVRDPGVNLILGEKTDTPLRQRPLTHMAASAVTEGTGQNLEGYRDYRGVRVIGSWMWSDRLGFGMTTEIDVAEAYALLDFNRRIVTFSTIVLGILFLGFSTFLLRYMTESKKSAQILIENEQTTRLLLNSTGEGIYGIDLNGACTFANRTCLDLLGNQSLDELLGRNMHKVMHHTRNDGTPFPVEECKIFQAFRLGAGTHVDDEVLWRQDGTSFDAEYRSFPIRLHGNVIGAVVSFTDISAQLENEIRQRTVVATMVDGLITFAEDGTIDSFNPAAEKTFGYSSEEIIGENIKRLLPEPHRSEHHTYLERYKTTGGANIPRASGVDIEGLRKNGDTFPAAVSVSTMFISNHRRFNAVVRDITARKGLELERERVAEELAQLIDTANAPIFGIDTDGKITVWNQTAARLTGYSMDDMLGQELVAEFITDDYKKSVGEVLDNALRGQETANYEFPLFTKEGGRLEILLNATTRRDVDGTISGVIGIGQDITARKKSEEELHRSEALLRYSQQVAHIGSWELNLIDEQYWWSDEAMRILGFSATTLPDGIEAFLEHLHPEDRDEVNASFQASVRDRSPFEETYRFQHHQLGMRWIHVLGGTTYDDDGTPLSTIGTLQDVSDRKESESKLIRSEALLSYSQQVAHIGSWELNLLDDQFWWSDEAIRILGFSPDTAPNSFKSFFDLVHCDDQDWVTESFLASQKDHTTFEATHRFEHQKLGTRWVHALAETRYDADGTTPLVSTGTVQDVTESRQKDAALQQAQKMEAVGQLTGGIAHDFNNLLTIIKGNLEFLEDGLAARGDSDLKELLDDAVSAANDGATLTNQLLAFSRKQTLKPEDLVVKEVLVKVSRMLRRTLGEAIEIEVAPIDEALKVVADPGQLEGALLNLSLNARDAMAGSGQLQLRCVVLDVSEQGTSPHAELAPGRYVSISVSDTGCGIPAEHLGQIFEPFFTTKETGAGTGLGLSMVHGFAIQSGGGVSVESEEGRGTKVSILLQEMSEEDIVAASNEHVPQGTLPGGHERILVVEDQAGVRRYAMRSLRHLGYAVLEAEDADQALSMLAGDNGEIDLVFSDIVMPGAMSGRDLAKHIDQLYPSIKVQLTTGYSERGCSTEISDGEKVDVLRKPYSRSELAFTLRAVLDGAEPKSGD